ncbi:MAG: PilZ domain-containing protein [Caldimonas sp.]
MSTQPLPQTFNRRATPRKAVRLAATVVYGDASRVVQTWDLGRDGMCLLAPRPIAPGTRCSITFEVPLGAERVGITAAAKVVYSSYSAAGEFKIGAMFTDLDEGAALVLGRFVADA